VSELENWAAQYGGFALFFLLVFGIIGLPVPDETLLVFCGYLIYKGKLNPVGTWLGGALGSLVGITGSYIIGRTLGLGLLHSRFGKRLHITDARIRKVHDWFDRVGHWALFIGYYIPGVRHFTALVAGTSRLEFHSFALYAYAGGCVWVSSFLMLGYWFGDDWERMFAMVHRNLVAVSLIAGGVVLVYFLVRWYQRQRA
jgi:membrane protein DedA with SNARE-associated domain